MGCLNDFYAAMLLGTTSRTTEQSPASRRLKAFAVLLPMYCKSLLLVKDVTNLSPGELAVQTSTMEHGRPCMPRVRIVLGRHTVLRTYFCQYLSNQTSSIHDSLPKNNAGIIFKTNAKQTERLCLDRESRLPPLQHIALSHKNPTGCVQYIIAQQTHQ